MGGGEVISSKISIFYSRVKLAFSKDEHGEMKPEISHIPIVVFCGSLVGFMIGGRHGARIRAMTTIANNQLTVYKSTTQAKREYFTNILLGYMQYGSRWGWRTGLYAGIYSTTLTSMSIGRDTDDAVNYITAGGATGFVYKTLSGFRGMVTGTILGALICTPIGLFMQLLGHFIPYEQVRKESRQLEIDRKQQQIKAAENIVNRIEQELEESKTI